VEDRWRPKSDSGVDAGTEQGIPPEEVDQYGRGKYDETTGLYEWYEDVPKEVAAGGAPISWGRILGAWRELESDFRSVYGVRLASPKVRRRMSWREFTTLVHGLLTAETRLWRELKPEGDEDGSGGTDDRWVDQRETDA
jgi:hypothetical protein